MDLQTQLEVKTTRDVLRSEIVKALYRAQAEGFPIPVEVQELLRVEAACVESTVRYNKDKTEALSYAYVNGVAA